MPLETHKAIVRRFPIMEIFEGIQGIKSIRGIGGITRIRCNAAL